MKNLKRLIVSPEYPNGILVDLTAEEIAQRKIDEQQVIAEEQARQAKKQAKEIEEQAKENAKASALAKLKALGLTEEEVKSIL